MTSNTTFLHPAVRPDVALAALPAPPAADGKGRPSGRAVRQVATFGLIGVASSLAYAGLYAALRPAVPAAVANAVALLLTAIANTTANRRLTFDVRGRDRMARDQAAGLVALAVALGITSASLAGLACLVPDASRALELVVLVAANALATVARFVLLRLALDRSPAERPAAEGSPPERSPAERRAAAQPLAMTSAAVLRGWLDAPAAQRAADGGTSR